MAKVQIKSEKLTPFGGIFMVMEQFDSMLSSVIGSTLGQRCSSVIGYQYSEIVRSLMSVYFCGGSCVEDITSHLMRHLSYHPTLRTCSSDTILRAIRELTQGNISYTSDQGRTYDFNTADKLNTLLVNALVSTGGLREGEGYDVDFDHQFLETEKYDAMVYMSLMCGLLLVVLGGYLRWSIGKVEAMPMLKPIITITTLLLLVDGVSAAAFMPHNPFAWTIAILCVAAFVTGNVSKLSNK